MTLALPQDLRPRLAPRPSTSTTGPDAPPSPPRSDHHSVGALVEAAAQLAADPVEVVVYTKLEEIPPFNPDLDELDPPAPVARFRAALQACDGVLISSPEYAHGVSGVMKNALDWVVGSGELVDKPVALINASLRATHAHAALMETLTVMSAQIVPGASITVPLQGRRLDANGIAADPALSAALGAAVDTLASAARSHAREAVES